MGSFVDAVNLSAIVADDVTSGLVTTPSFIVNNIDHTTEDEPQTENSSSRSNQILKSTDEPTMDITTKIGTQMEIASWSNETNSTDGPTIAEIAKQNILWISGIRMHQYYLPILLPVGCVGNILSFLVMIQPQNRRNSCCNYMAALAVTDLCMIYVAAHYWVVTSGFFRSIYYYECKMLAWTFNLFSLMGISIILFMTGDRFIAVKFPFRAPTMCTPRRARITIAVIVLGMIAYTGPYLYTAGLVNNSTCAAITTKSMFTTVYSWVNVFLVSIVPFCSLLSMNIVIIRVIRNRGKYFKKTTDSENKDTKDAKDTEKSNKDAQLTFMLLLVTFTFLLLTLPLYVRYVLTIAIDYTSDPYLYAVYIFLYHLSNKLYFTNNAINFYLYCIGGAKFRADLASLCGKKTKKSHDASITLSSTVSK